MNPEKISGKMYQPVIDSQLDCGDESCVFFVDNTCECKPPMNCSRFDRKDRKDVYFIEIK